MANYIAYDDKIAAGGNFSGTAATVEYDNTTSGLTATNTQSAIDELASNDTTKVSKSGDTMTGLLDITNGGLKVYGRVVGGGGTDDEGIVITPFTNGYAGVCLGDPAGRRSVFYMNSSKAYWKYLDSGSVGYEIDHPKKNGTIALTSDIPDISTKVNKSGDTISGKLGFSYFDKVGINFRLNHPGYDGTVCYQTGRNEALVFATKADVTSFMFVNGEDSETNANNLRWQSLTPGLQIKNNCVYIGQLIANGITPSYKFYVKGNSYLYGSLEVNGISPATGSMQTYYALSHRFYQDEREQAYATLYAAAFTVSSSRKYKTNIENMTNEDALSLLQLRPVTFDYINGNNNQKGLIAEEVADVDDFTVARNEDNEPDSIDYSKFTPQLIKLCQIQQNTIENQQKQIDSLNERLEALEKLLNK